MSSTDSTQPSKAFHASKEAWGHIIHRLSTFSAGIQMIMGNFNKTLPILIDIYKIPEINELIRPQFSEANLQELLAAQQRINNAKNKISEFITSARAPIVSTVEEIQELSEKLFVNLTTEINVIRTAATLAKAALIPLLIGYKTAIEKELIKLARNDKIHIDLLSEGFADINKALDEMNKLMQVK